MYLVQRSVAYTTLQTSLIATIYPELRPINKQDTRLSKKCHYQNMKMLCNVQLACTAFNRQLAYVWIQHLEPICKHINKVEMVQKSAARWAMHDYSHIASVRWCRMIWTGGLSNIGNMTLDILCSCQLTVSRDRNIGYLRGGSRSHGLNCNLKIIFMVVQCQYHGQGFNLCSNTS